MSPKRPMENVPMENALSLKEPDVNRTKFAHDITDHVFRLRFRADGFVDRTPDEIADLRVVVGVMRVMAA